MTVRYQWSPSCLSKSMCVFDESLEDDPKKEDRKKITWKDFCAFKMIPLPKPVKYNDPFTFVYYFVDKVVDSNLKLLFSHLTTLKLLDPTLLKSNSLSSIGSSVVPSFA